jgi:TRAP-type C4-dicarboxylate transport system substrate-binding protein
MSRSTGLLLLLVPMLATGCAGFSTSGDKAGGAASRGPVILRLASTPGDLSDAPPVADFVRWTRELTHGGIRIEVVNQWGNYERDAEVQVVRAVASGKADLGWAGSRVFDSLALSGFGALSAPMLVDNYRLEAAVLEPPIAPQLLGSLKGVGVTGLGLLPDVLRRPIGVHRPLLSPRSWRGVSFGTYRSRVQGQAIRALGARPVVAFGPFRAHALQTGVIQGFELDFRRYERLGLEQAAPYVAANVALWPQVDVLIANPRRLSSLTDQQRALLRQAADEAVWSASELFLQDATFAGKACAAGARFALATPANLAALRRSFSPVYRRLEEDPRTRSFIRRIERLKHSTGRDPALAIPAGCSSG